LALHDPPIDVPFVDMETGMVTEPWREWLIINKRDKANRYESATENNIALLDAEGHPIDSNTTLSDQINDSQVFANLVTTKLIASDGSGGITEVDLYNWLAAGTGITGADDGDGTMTIDLKQQTNVTDASNISSVTVTAGADTIDISATDSTLATMRTEINAIVTKVNAILAILLGSEVMAGP
jgi:hypothetical protein